VVSSIQLTPDTTGNGAAYDVAIDAPNPDLALEPGMTATASIVIDRRDDALRAPN
jgi:HlyD family secretion protein